MAYAAVLRLFGRRLTGAYYHFFGALYHPPFLSVANCRLIAPQIRDDNDDFHEDEDDEKEALGMMKITQFVK